ncbi:MAG: helix-turn-helix domain-containing protein [Candidatus Bathyarchaeia archaeon]
MDSNASTGKEAGLIMKLVWIKGYHRLSLNRPDVWICLGVRGSGKSSFLEHLAEEHLDQGNCVLDLFAARSGESLAWLRNEKTKNKRILLLSAENAQVVAPGNVEVKAASKISIDDFENFDIVINSCVLYPNIDSEFEAVNAILDKLWLRRKWKKLVFVVCREAANIVYSRMKIADNQTLAKTFLAYWLRESRHTGCSIALDSQRFMALDVDIRSLADYMVLKAQGASGIPKDMHFIYRYVEPSWLQYAKQNEFIMLTRKGDIAIGIFEMPKWHAQEGEDVAGKLGIKVSFEDQPIEGVNKGDYKTVGDEEHAEIMRLYKDENLSMARIAKKLSRSSGTIKVQIDKHNESIVKLGYCPACRRVKSKFELFSVQR